jgi:hypothetical protein
VESVPEARFIGFCPAQETPPAGHAGNIGLRRGMVTRPRYFRKCAAECKTDPILKTGYD